MNYSHYFYGISFLILVIFIIRFLNKLYRVAKETEKMLIELNHITNTIKTYFNVSNRKFFLQEIMIKKIISNGKIIYKIVQLLITFIKKEWRYFHEKKKM